MFKPKPLKPVLLAIGFKLFYSLEAIARGALKRFSVLKGIAVGNFRTPRVLGNIALVLFVITSVTSAYLIVARPSVANATTSSYLNFQARLESSTGAIAPDGNYDVAFHLYNASSSTGSTNTGCGTDANCLWSESYTYNSGPSSSDVRVRVANGYLTVNLGSITAFGSINWDQQLYLTMNIGGTTASGPITWDGEMSPRITLTAVPYAFQSKSSTQLQATVASNTGTLRFDTTMTGGSQTFVLPDQGAAGTYDLLTQQQANGDFIQNGTSPQTADFNITGTGTTGGLTVTNAGNVAFQKASDYSSTGVQVDVNFGTGALVRLTGGSALTIDSVQGGANGRILTIINASGNAATIRDQSTATTSTSANKIITGTGANITLPADASISLVYDSGNSRWRVVGSVGSGAAFLQGGNSFGTQAILGTDDANSLAFETNNTTRLVVDTSATTNFTFQQASVLKVASATAGTQLTIQGGDASGAGNNGGNLLLQAGAGGSGATSGSVIIKSNGSNSTTALTVQKYTGGQVLGVDTTNNAIVLGNDGSPSALTVRGGAATGSNVTGANLTFDASNGTGAGGSGDLIFRTAGTSGSTITQDAVSKSSNAGSTSSLTWSHTVGTQSNRILIVGLVTSTATNFTGVVWDPAGANQSFTQLSTNQTCPTVVVGCHMSVWYLVNPATGTHSIRATSGSAANSSGGAVSYYNVDTSTPFGTAATATGSASGATSVVATTSATQLVVGVIGADNNTSSAGSGQTELWKDNFVFTSIGSSKPGTGGNVTMNWTVNSGGWATIGAPLNPAPNSVADTLQDRFHITAGGNIGVNTSSPQYTLDVTGTGNFTTSVLTPLLDTATGTALNIGTANATSVTIGNATAAGGNTTVQAKGNVLIATNSVQVATFDTSGHLYLGNGVTAGTPSNFTIQGTGSTTTAVAGGSITIQGGNATVGNANGGNITVSGGAGVGTGVSGLVILTTPTFQTAGTQSCSGSCTITQANIDGSSTIVINVTSGSGVVVTMPNPTITGTYGRVVYVTAASGSLDFTLRVNGGGAGNDISMRSNTTATMIWGPGSGSGAWTAAGASSSTTLQAAYDNTLTSAGGAELILSKTTNHDGLTIRDSLTSPVNGTLLEVQTQNASSLFSVNGTVTDYANNGGAESTFGSEWAASGTGASISRNTTAAYVANGLGSAKISTTGTANTGGKNVLNASLTANLRYNVSFAAKLDSTSSGSFTDVNVYYSVDGTATSVACSNYSTQTVPTSVWAKINCTFTAPSSGITSTNAILIRQTAAATRSWYVDNLSVTISADLSYATDGGVDNSASFNTNWPALGSATTTWDNSTGNDTSDSAKVVTGASTNQGIKNVLAINPLATNPGTLYRISVYAKLLSGTFTDFSIGYSPDDGGVAGANFRACADYNIQALSTSTWSQITCYITTTTATVSAPRVYFYQPTATARTFWVDTFSMTLASNAVPNVQVGGGVYGGPTTLFTLDRAASAPIASNNDALLGSMYYDTTLGKLQCYEADGWGACGSSPDNIITISPEYTNAVLHGSGVGTMTSDICSGASGGLNINTTICGTNETYNFYKWTSPQANAQTYSIYVTYQLPSTFKSFSSGTTSVMGRTDSTNSTVQYSVYRNNTSSGLTQCGSAISVSTGSVSSWQIGVASGAADPSTCGFAASDSIIFKIDVIASSNANAYVGNLGFTFSNK